MVIGGRLKMFLVYGLRRLAQTFPRGSQRFCTPQRSRLCLFPPVNPAA